MESTTITKASLVKYTLLSLVFAAIVLVTIILPAEYNIDPTGIGQKLGLTVFNDSVVAEIDASTEGVAENLEESSKTSTAPITIEVIVPAGRGVEYKFTMGQYQKLKYEWATNGVALYFDLHGEPKGDTTGYFESYVIATSNEMEGSFTTPFAGSHGWYWKNTTDAPVVVQLIVQGEFMEHGLK